MMRFWEDFLGFGGAIKRWANTSSKKQRFAAMAICGIMAVAMLIGGELAAFSFSAFLTCAVFWAMIHETPRFQAWMFKWGWILDIAITLGALVGSGGTLGGFLLGLYFDTFFSLFRIMLAPSQKTEEADLVPVEESKR